MAKPSNNRPVPADARKVRVLISKNFLNTLKNFRGKEEVLVALKDFIAFKRQNPTGQFGAKDYPFRGSNLKGYTHAGLTFDASVIYTIGGRDPHIIRLYGVYTHDQLGTGNPPRMNLQASAAKTFNNTTDFTPYEKVDEAAKKVNLDLLETFLTLSH